MPRRTSGLLAPNMLCTGHNAAVYSLAFDPSGQHAASGSFDRQICRLIEINNGHVGCSILLGWDGSGTENKRRFRGIDSYVGEGRRRLPDFYSLMEMYSCCSLALWFMFVSRTVCWNVYGECTNYMLLKGHKNAVLQVQWTYDSR